MGGSPSRSRRAMYSKAPFSVASSGASGSRRSGFMPSASSHARPSDHPVMPLRALGCGYDRPIASRPARAAPLDLLLFGQQIIGVGLDEQLHEHWMHDVLSPGPGSGPGPGPAAVPVACRARQRAEDRARPLIHSASTVMSPVARARDGTSVQFGADAPGMVAAVSRWRDHRTVTDRAMVSRWLAGGCPGFPLVTRQAGGHLVRQGYLRAGMRGEDQPMQPLEQRLVPWRYPVDAGLHLWRHDGGHVPGLRFDPVSCSAARTPIAVCGGCGAQRCSTTISEWPVGSRNQNIGGTGSPIRDTSASTSSPRDCKAA